MKFDEQKAIEIVERFGLAKSTINVWRNRQAIPDKYTTGQVKEPIETESELQQASNVLRALATEKFNIASLSRLAEVSSYCIRDVQREKASFSKQELLSIKKAINTLRNEVKAIAQSMNRKVLPETAIQAISKLFDRQELQLFIFLDRKKDVFQKFDGWKAGRRGFPVEEQTVLQAALYKFLTETAI